jgi:hypothetical protein
MRQSIKKQRHLHVALIIVTVGFVVSICLAKTVPGRKVGAPFGDESQAVYSHNPKDPWNSIFYHLFTRRVRARLTDEFSGSGPFFKVNVMGFPQGLSVSTRLFERIEDGDRAIDPFYPSFITSAGLYEALSEPRFSQLKQALTVALNEKKARPALHRTLMQSDAWAAHDLLARVSRYRGDRVAEQRERASQVVPLLAQLVKKLALTRDEIKGLPDNYALAAKEHHLPDLFSSNSEWMEVQWIPNRVHDHAADFRRVARVFLKPSLPLRDRQSFLDGLPNNHGDTPELGAVALVIQNLVVDSQGNIVATRLTYEVQIRTFKRDGQGRLVKTELSQYELSRKLVLERPRTGGMIAFGEGAPMYLPMAGNDYSFATPQRDQRGDTSPILATLRTRCGACHGQPNAPTVFTFRTHAPEPIPPVMLLEQPNDIHARYVAGRKTDQEDYKKLLERWNK